MDIPLQFPVYVLTVIDQNGKRNQLNITSDLDAASYRYGCEIDSPRSPDTRKILLEKRLPGSYIYEPLQGWDVKEQCALLILTNDDAIRWCQNHDELSIDVTFTAKLVTLVLYDGYNIIMTLREPTFIDCVQVLAHWSQSPERSDEEREKYA